jgi:hypothetical protein
MTTYLSRTQRLVLCCLFGFVGACGGASSQSAPDRATLDVARYKNDPLTAPVDIGLARGGPPVAAPAGRRPTDDRPFRHARVPPSTISYWFVVPPGSDRQRILGDAAAQLEGRGWRLEVSTDDRRVLASDPGTDHLRINLVVPEPTSERLLQEVVILH